MRQSFLWRRNDNHQLLALSSSNQLRKRSPILDLGLNPNNFLCSRVTRSREDCRGVSRLLCSAGLSFRIADDILELEDCSPLVEELGLSSVTRSTALKRSCLALSNLAWLATLTRGKFVNSLIRA